GEIQQTCDRVAILDRGRCVVAGPVTDVLQTGHPIALVVRLDELAAGLAALEAAGIPAELAGDALHVGVPPSSAASVTRTLAARDLWVTELRPLEAYLEDIFLELTGYVQS